MDMMESHDRVQLEETKQDILLRFAHADAVSSRIGYVFGDTKKRRQEDIVQPWTMFPSLFKTEAQKQKEAEEARRAELHKRQMEAFAARWNKRTKGR